MQPYQALEEQLKLHKGIPYTPHWSAAPDFMQLIVDHVLEHKPGTILECSSGLTSLMLARSCQLNQRGHLYSLENGASYAEKSREYIQRYQLEDYASILHAPLETTTIEGSDYQWYSQQAIPPHKIDMLVIDGPPGFIQKHSRYPALPLLFDRLADHCSIFLDDAARDDEKAIVALWLEKFPALTHRYLDTERGCSILQLER